MAYNQCPRQFYLTNKVNWPSVQSEEQYSAYALGGIAFHRAISEQIERWSRCDEIDIEMAKTRVKQFINRCYSHPEKTLLEIANGYKLPDNICEATLISTLKNVNKFFLFIWPRFVGHTYVLHERLEWFEVSGAKVLVKIDLCTIDTKGRLVITDWKTGLSSRIQDNYWQMTTYALWAKYVRKERPENIILQIVNVKMGSFDLMEPIERDYESVTEKIRAEISLWQNDTTFGQYSPTPDIHRCQGCVHLIGCAEGRSLVDDSSQEGISE